MDKRRGHGDGSIYWVAGRQRWVGSVSLGLQPDGRRSRRSVVGKTKQEVQRKLRDLRRRADNGLPAADARLKVGTFLDQWLAGLAGTIEASTLNGYKLAVRLHIKPALGAKLLTNLSVSDVDQLWARKRTEGYSANYVRILRSTLRRALVKAEREGIVVRNVAALSTPAKLDRPEGRSLTVEQARVLLDAARGDRTEACYLLMLTYGLRRGEALGLAWVDLNLDSTTLVVRQGVKRETVQPDEDGTYPGGRRTRVVLGPLKTAKSRRILTLTAPVIDALRAHRARQAAETLAAGSLWSDHGLIFTSTVGTPYDPGNFAHAFVRLCERAGLGHWHPHEMRHSAASIMLAQGTPLHVVSEILGHSSITITKDVYGHLVEGERRAAAEAMSAALTLR